MRIIVRAQALYRGWVAREFESEVRTYNMPTYIRAAILVAIGSVQEVEWSAPPPRVFRGRCVPNLPRAYVIVADVHDGPPGSQLTMTA